MIWSELNLLCAYSSQRCLSPQKTLCCCARHLAKTEEEEATASWTLKPKKIGVIKSEEVIYVQ